jgi:AraC-like DNA-binding protein/quercetin dioxygenase-like cupin family protein
MAKSQRQAQPSSRTTEFGELFPDQSYLAYLRPSPRPFFRFTSGHFPAGTVTHPHSHACIALHGCLQGPLSLLATGEEQMLDAGVFYLIAPGVSHYWRNKARHTAATLGLLIDTERPGRWPAGAGVEACCRKLRRLVQGLHRFHVAGDSELQRTFWLLTDCLTAEEPYEATVTTGLLLTLLGQMCERIGGNTTVPVPADAARQIRRLLLARVNDRLTIDEIAEELGLGPTRAKQVFREAFGCGIITYFNQLKIWRAKRLLCNPSLTIEQIGFQLGFENAGYFSRVFLKHTGETPSRFRSQSSVAP